jgi:hypothetical protein
VGPVVASPRFYRTVLPLSGGLVHRRPYSSVQVSAKSSSYGSKGASNADGGLQSLFLSDISLVGQRTPILLGFFNYFERHLPNVGFFEPIAAEALASSELKIDRHVEL